jgi:GDP-4-dehydro-6-deoxy-D-mannose reductase
MIYLITGVAGFVGVHLSAYLLSRGHSIVGVDVCSGKGPKGVRFCQMSLMDSVALRGLIDDVRPDRIVHLASASSVAFSWENPVECFVNNTNIFLNLVEAVRHSGVRCRILSVGSSEEYGPVSGQDVPLKESRPANPMNPYAVARVAQEQLSRVYAKGYGMDIVCTRSFNHVGPGQTDRFVVSSWVRQAVEVSRGERASITCGSLDIIRDWVDVRDVVRAYELILDKGVAGGLYNVCSGRGTALRTVLDMICCKVGIAMVIDQPAHLIRPIDNPVIIGSDELLRGLGFTCTFDLDRSLDDLIVWWKNDIRENLG